MFKSVAVIGMIVAALSHGLSSHAAAAGPKVVIGYGAVNARVAPLWIAQEQKLFTKNGVDAEAILVRQIQVTIGGISTGEIQIGHTSGSTLLGAAAGGLDLKIVAALNNRSGYDLVAAPNIKSPKDLRGKRVGVNVFGGGVWIGAILGLEHLGLDPQRDNIQIVPIGDQTVITQALEKGLIDAASLDGVFSRKLKKEGFVILVEHNQANIPYTGLGLLLKTAFARERPDALEGILKGFVESIAFISSPKNKPLVIKTIMNHLRIADPAVAEEGFQDAVTSTEKRPFPSVEGLRNIQRLLKIGNPKLANVKVEELIDERILRRLDESGFINRIYSEYGVK